MTVAALILFQFPTLCNRVISLPNKTPRISNLQIVAYSAKIKVTFFGQKLHKTTMVSKSRSSTTDDYNKGSTKEIQSEPFLIK